MHEITIADRLLDRALEAAASADGGNVEALSVAIGEATHLNPTQVEFWLRELAADTPAEGVTVEIRTVSARGECPCGWTGDLPQMGGPFGPAPDRRCPECGQTTSLRTGTECRLESISVPDGDDSQERATSTP